MSTQMVVDADDMDDVAASWLPIASTGARGRDRLRDGVVMASPVIRLNVSSGRKTRGEEEQEGKKKHVFV